MSRTFKTSPADDLTHRIMGPSKAIINPHRAIKKVRHHRERRWATQAIRAIVATVTQDPITNL